MLRASSAATTASLLFHTHALNNWKLNVRLRSSFLHTERFSTTACESVGLFCFCLEETLLSLASLSGLSVKVKEVFGRDEVHDGNSRSLNTAGRSQSAAPINISGTKSVKLHTDVHRHRLRPETCQQVDVWTQQTLNWLNPENVQTPDFILRVSPWKHLQLQFTVNSL